MIKLRKYYKGGISMKKILGGKSQKCDCCGGNIYIIKIGTDIFYQCSSCGSLAKSVSVNEVRIYTSK